MPGAENEVQSLHIIGEGVGTSTLKGSKDSAPGSMIAVPDRSMQSFNFEPPALGCSYNIPQSYASLCISCCLSFCGVAITDGIRAS